MDYLSTLTEQSHLSSFSTSLTDTKLKSPGIVCFRHEVPRANSKLCLVFS